MGLIYTNDSSGAIRKLRRKKPTRSYLEALSKHIRYLRSMGFDVTDNGKIMLKKERTDSTPYRPETSKIVEQEIPLSNKIGSGGTKPDNSWKIEVSKNWTIAPAYNKGPYMVVAKEDIKTAGRKV
jgi:hypothetical protein